MHLHAQSFGEGLAPRPRPPGHRCAARSLICRVRDRRRLPPAGNDDLRQPIQQFFAGGDAAVKIGGEPVGAAQPRAQTDFAFLDCQLQPR